MVREAAYRVNTWWIGEKQKTQRAASQQGGWVKTRCFLGISFPNFQIRRGTPRLYSLPINLHPEIIYQKPVSGRIPDIQGQVITG